MTSRSSHVRLDVTLVLLTVFTASCAAESTSVRPAHARDAYAVKLRALYNATKESLVPLRSFFESALWTPGQEGTQGDEDDQHDAQVDHQVTPRFGYRKRMQLTMLPIMYKMGVMTTLLMGLTVLTLKGLTVGVILLIFAFGNLFAKWHHKSPHHAQPIHVHVHADGHGKPHTYSSYATGWGPGPWDRIAEDSNPAPSGLQDYDPRSYQRWAQSYSLPFSRHRTTAYRVT